MQKFNFKSALFVYGDDQADSNFIKASNNIPKISVLSQKGINVADLIIYEKIFIEETSIKKIGVLNLSDTQYRVFLGPFFNINSLQKAFSDINVLQFENIEIIKNDKNS